MNTFLRLLSERDWLLADGATGTNLFAAGLPTGHPPELWNQENPAAIAALHRSFIEAGSDIILTNTFGGNRLRLKLHGAQARTAELNHRAVTIAREQAENAGRSLVVAGSVGPTGELFEPLGPLSRDAAIETFHEQCQALTEAGADVIWLETMSAAAEVEAAVVAAAETGLPIVSTLSFDTSGRSMMGVTPADHARFCAGLQPRPSACGSNCGVGAAEVVAGMILMARTGDADQVLVAKANCGVPEFVDGAIRYNGTPELMARYACLARDAGARIIGGCCGTTPAHLRAMHDALSGHGRGDSPTLEQIEAGIGPVSDGARLLLLGGQGPKASGGGRRRRAG